MSFGRKSLNDAIDHYYNIVSGKGTKADFAVPVLHRCLSHVMKNAKDMCKKYAPKHYHLAMHIFGLFTTASTLEELDEMVQSAAVVFNSPSSAANVEKHFQNLQTWLLRCKVQLDDAPQSSVIKDDLKDIPGNNNFAKHYRQVVSNAPLDMEGEANLYYCKGLMVHLTKYILPYAGLWTGIMLGDLGRHGHTKAYKDYSQRYCALLKIQRQNTTEDTKTQGIMEKSQWDLKHIRFRSRRLTRLDDFVSQYQSSHTALLRDFEDSKKVLGRKRFRVDTERWKERKQKKRGKYVTAVKKPFPFKRSAKKVDSSVIQSPLGAQSDPSSQQPRSSVQGDNEARGSGSTSDIPSEKIPPHEGKRLGIELSQNFKVSVWKADLTTFPVDAVVNAANVRLEHAGGLAHALSEAGGPVIKTERDNYIAQFGTLKTSSVVVTNAGNLPCQKITDAVGPRLSPNPSAATLLSAKKKLKKAIWNILDSVELHQLTSVAIPAVSSGIFNFPVKHCAEVIVVTIKEFHSQRVLHGPLTVNLVNNDTPTVIEMEKACAKILSCDDTLSPTQKKIKGSSSKRSSQSLIRLSDDTSSPPQKKIKKSSSPSSSPPQEQQMARAVMEAFPALPVFSFGTSKKAVSEERKKMGLQILKLSVFDVASNCALCSMAKSRGPGPQVTNWIQCDSCGRWFHEQCLGMTTKDLEKAKNESWDCQLCH
ncbi:hypothetical protein ABVT39_000967 [Epinephelus coioides]